MAGLNAPTNPMTGKLMPGIHHSAICTADVDRSMKFWRDGLGFTELHVQQSRSLQVSRLIDVSCKSALAPMPKAVQFDSYGGVDVLEVRDVPRPVPGAGEVLVEVRAAGINISEAAIRAGAVRDMFPATFPSGQGSDLAGVVAELGSGVTGFAVGDDVIGFSNQRSSHAEYVTVPADQLTPKPAAVPWEVAGLFDQLQSWTGALKPLRG